jgi:hypothetical protein
MRLVVAVVSHMAKNIRESDPSMTVWQSYQEALNNMFSKDDGLGK